MLVSTLSCVLVTPLPVAPAIRFTPFRLAPLAKELICCRPAVRLAFICVWLIPCVCPCVSVCCKVDRTEEMLSVELIAVPTTCAPNDRLSCTAVRPAIWPSMAWVMEYTAGLSAAVATARPVEIWFCVVVSAFCVCSSDCNAVMAPRLVFTENSDMGSSFLTALPGCAAAWLRVGIVARLAGCAPVCHVRQREGFAAAHAANINRNA